MTYQSDNYMNNDEFKNITLGKVFTKVKHKIADEVFDTNYKIKDGDAAFHKAGTKIYSVVGYDTNFRLSIDTDNGIRLYEVDNNPNASLGIDILDITDKVDYITLNPELDEKTVIATIDNETDVVNITNIILNSPIVDKINITSDNRYFLDFHLIDGTKVTRCYWIDDGILVPNILLPSEIKDIITPFIER